MPCFSVAAAAAGKTAEIKHNSRVVFNYSARAQRTRMRV